MLLVARAHAIDSPRATGDQMGRNMKSPSLKVFAAAAFALAALFLSTPGAAAWRFDRFAGDFAGNVRIKAGVVTFKGSAGASFEPASGGKGKLTVTGKESRPHIRVKVMLESGGRCEVKLQPTSSVRIIAKGHFRKRTNSKIELTITGYFGGVTLSGPGTLIMKSYRTMEMSGSLTSDDSSLKVKYYYRGARTN